MIAFFTSVCNAFIFLLFYNAVPDENVGTVKYKAKVMKGEMRTALLDGDSVNYDLDRGFTRHSIEDDTEPEGIVIELGKPSILNTIRLLLWDRDNRCDKRLLANQPFLGNIWIYIWTAWLRPDSLTAKCYL